VKPPLLIVTASGLAREVMEAARALGDRQIIGFVDDDPAQWGRSYDGLNVVGPLEHVDYFPDCELAICAGRGSVREALESRLLRRGVAESRFATIVHPSVALPGSVRIASGTVILGGCVLTAAVSVGRHVVIMPNVTLTHDDVVGDYATLCAGVTLGGNVHVGPGAYLGMLAAVRENLTVGADSTVGMGSVVIRDVPGQQTWAGVPAQPMGAAGRDLRTTAWWRDGSRPAAGERR
jgi:sugar O-acyltransferase (sialic acid O-acetyltransferase NeuD family)